MESVLDEFDQLLSVKQHDVLQFLPKVCIDKGDFVPEDLIFEQVLVLCGSGTHILIDLTLLRC
jgi:hypothetical protein